MTRRRDIDSTPVVISGVDQHGNPVSETLYIPPPSPWWLRAWHWFAFTILRRWHIDRIELP